MADWEDWRNLAEETRIAAKSLQALPRSCVSRCYYATYQIATAFLHYQRRTPPSNREAWAHPGEEYPTGSMAGLGRTDIMLMQELQKVISRGQVNVVLSHLRTLYKMRIKADYHAKAIVAREEAINAQRMMEMIFRILHRCFPKE